MMSVFLTARPAGDVEAAIGNKLLSRDKAEVCGWQAALRTAEIERVVILDHSEAGADQVDLVLVYGAATPSAAGRCARWGITRRDEAILLWRCDDGAALGVFRSMRAALTAVETQVARLRASGTGRGLAAE
jgi:hypothetical protein